MMTLVIVVPIISIGMLGNGDFSTQPKYDSTMLPPLYQLRSPSDVTSFVEGSTALFSALDKQIAAEQLAQKSDDGVSH